MAASTPRIGSSSGLAGGRAAEQKAEGPRARNRDARDQRLAAVASVVEHEIVPRLIASHAARLGPLATPGAIAGPGPAGGATPDAADLDADTVAAFAAELIASDRAAGERRIAQLRRDGMSPETVCLRALAPVARHLGDLWVKDHCSFIDVTNGTALLHSFMNLLRLDFTAGPMPIGTRRSVMLVTAPGEQHRFGLSMLAEFFRKDGWRVMLPLARTIAQVAAQVTAQGASRPVDVIGLSAGSDRHLGALAACIAALRTGACNPDLVIMVGGPIFLARPDLVRAVGADGTGHDAEDAVRQAFALLQDKRAVGRRPAAAAASPRARSAAPAACDRDAAHAR